MAISSSPSMLLRVDAKEDVYYRVTGRRPMVRADLSVIAGGFPAIDELLLLACELATNAILHSQSGHPGRRFTVRATLYPGEYAWVEVVDQGGTWAQGRDDDECGRGLEVVAATAGDGNWGIDGDETSRAAWFRLDWPAL